MADAPNSNCKQIMTNRYATRVVNVIPMIIVFSVFPSVVWTYFPNAQGLEAFTILSFIGNIAFLISYATLKSRGRSEFLMGRTMVVVNYVEIVFDSLAAFFICLFAILMTTQSPCAGAGIAMFLSDVCSRYNTAIAFGFISVATNIWTIVMDFVSLRE